MYTSENYDFLFISQFKSTVVPTKSDSDVILCLQLLSKTLHVLCVHFI